MRLQLTVQRHGIPPVQVLWTVTPTRPPLAAAGSSVTVSQFLEQINDIIPLESENWGLEDYAVEVGGFECLHFCELAHILKEDDQVHIRPLQTTDLRIRKISGRHQISADGKHLIDGVAFGRPYLRKAERPAVRIPARKRRRVAYNDDDDDDDDVIDGRNASDQQLVLRDGFQDAATSILGTDSDDDEEFLPNSEENEDLETELEDLQHDVEAGANGEERTLVARKVRQPLRRSKRVSQRSPQGLGLLRLTENDNHSFVGDHDSSHAVHHQRDQPPAQGNSFKTGEQGTPKKVKRLSSTVVNTQDQRLPPERIARRDPASSNKNVHFEAPESATPATIRISQDSDEDDDDDFVPGEADDSDKENAEPRAIEAGSSDDASSASGSSSVSNSNQVDSDETSSSGSSLSDSSSDSDSEPERLPVTNQKIGSQSSNTSSTSSDESSSSSSDSKASTPPIPATWSKRAQKQARQFRTGDPNRLLSAKGPPPNPPRKTVPPGQGMKKTALRNKRRKEQKRLASLKCQGILPGEATVADLRLYQQGIENQAGQSKGAGNDSKVESATVLDAKRQILLSSIATGGINVSPFANISENNLEGTPGDDQPPGQHITGTQTAEQQTQPSHDERPQLKLTCDEPLSEAPTVPPVLDTSRIEDETTEKSPGATAQIDPGSKPGPSSQQQRSKLDVSGAKRMLFGSLGLRNPKTKQDELKTREELMKGVRPIKEPEVETRAESLEDIAADDSWRDKIDLRAVECCYEGITLSTPPFPFVQRWDPQQRRGYNNNNSQNRKGKKRKRNNNSYYDNNTSQNSQGKATRYNEYQAPEGESELPDVDMSQSNHVDEQHHQSPEPDFKYSQAVNDQLLRETGEASAATLRDTKKEEEEADLPSLPEDPTSCPSLTREAAKEGAIIAFKQLEMSADTDWQPKISDYRTALVNQVTEDGVLQMTPAKRDRPDRQVEYDDKTGERLYSKFEMPGYNDGEDEDRLEISFDELISPILVSATPDDMSKDNERIPQGNGRDAEMLLEESPKYPAKPNNGAEGGQEFANDSRESGTENREEISELMRNAGWRSSVQSELKEELITSDGPDSRERGKGEDDTTLIYVHSPNFNGLSPSPLVNVRSSPPVSEPSNTKRSYASGTEIAESVPPQDLDAKTVVSDSNPTVEYPSLPQVGDDSEFFHEEAQRRSDPIIEQHSLSQDYASNGMDPLSPQSTGSPEQSSHENGASKPVPTFNGAAQSEDEFPEPFSQVWETRMSQEIDKKPEFSDDEDAISPPSYKKSKVVGARASSQRESNRSWKLNGDSSAVEGEDEDNDEDGASTPRSSQKPRSSGVVDLTISSDDPDGDAYSHDNEDSFKLPKGPGWVKKSKVGGEGSTSARVSMRSWKAAKRQ